MLATFTIVPALASVIGSTVTVDCPAPRASTKGWSIHVRPDSRAAILATVATMLARLPVAGSLDDAGQPREAGHPARVILADALAGNRPALAMLATAGVEAYARPATMVKSIMEGEEGGHDAVPRFRSVLASAMMACDHASATLADGPLWNMADYTAPCATVRTYATAPATVATPAPVEVAPAKAKRKAKRKA